MPGPPEGETPRPVPGPLLVIAAAALWGSTGTAQALGPDAASPLQVGTLRILVGAAGLAALVASRGQLSAAVRTLGRGGRRWAVAATVSIAAYQVTFFAGVAATGVAIGTLVGIGSAPIATGLLSAAMGTRPGRRWVVGTAVTVVGAAVLALQQGDATVDPLGLALAIGAGVSYAVYTVATKALMLRGHPSTPVMAATWAGGALLLAPGLLGAGSLAWTTSPSGATMVLWLGLATVALGYVLYGHGLARLPASTVASLTLAEPLTATLLAVAVLGERLSSGAAVGAALVAAGLVVVSLRPRRRGEVGPTRP